MKMKKEHTNYDFSNDNVNKIFYSFLLRLSNFMTMKSEIVIIIIIFKMMKKKFISYLSKFDEGRKD